MNLESSPARADTGRLFACLLRFLLAAILSGSQIFGSYAPFALGFVAASGAGMEGLSALLGLLVGALLFFPFTEAMKYIAAGILIFSVAVAFYDTKLYRRAPFLPLTTAACTAAVGFVYLSQSSLFSADGAYFLLEVFLAGLCAACYRTALQRTCGRSRSQLFCCLFAAVTLLIALAAIPLAGFLSLGRILAVLLVLTAGRLGGPGLGCAAGICTGLAMDTVSGGLYFSMAYGLSALLAGWRRCGRALYTLLFLCGALLSLFWAEDDVAIYALLETAVAGVLFLLLPEKLFRKARAGRTREHAVSSGAPEQQLRRTAAVFRDLYNSLSHSSGGSAPLNDENIATVFDRAADQVCRACPLCATCWDQDYITTYNALNDVSVPLNERGHVLPSDFPTHFSGRCVRLADFISAVNAEFTALLMRRQYKRQLESTRHTAKEQYARLSELLSESADRIGQSRGEEQGAEAAPAAAASPVCQTGIAMQPKAGQAVSGDTAVTFRSADGRTFLLLSDGMGCGEEARRESAMTARLLEQFLCSGIEPPTALKTLNTALTLHSDESGSFTTIDLLVLSEHSGMASFYKYGAAPSYVKHGDTIRRVSSSVLPAGLGGSEIFPDATTLCMLPGDLAVLVSDGFVDSEDDGWLQAMLGEWTGGAPEALAAQLMEASQRRSGRSDDASVLILYLPPLSAAPTAPV